MLERHTFAGPVVAYRSPLLLQAGVQHAFSTRIGGISPPPFDSMNLGNPNGCAVQDDYEHIWENYRRLQRAAGLAHAEKPLRVHQVHGGVVLRAKAGEPFDCNAKADAIVSDEPASVVSVRIADCVPILLATGDGKTVAAVHAGWRGIIAGIIPAALREMTDSPGRVIAAIGPSIGMEAFEVGPEVLEEFQKRFGADAPVRSRADGKGHVELRQAARLQLLELEIPPDRIDTTDRCTFRDREDFFSHRRENGTTGRMAALIQARRVR